MTEKPILFSAPMVRAILDGRKTQTRRILKGSTEFKGPYSSAYLEAHRNAPGWKTICPYGVPGDRLWVRESFQPLLADNMSRYKPDYKTGVGYKIHYCATDGITEFYDMSTDNAFCSKITPSIFMPRWASRITLEIADVRVQRLQDIGEEDALAEGLSVQMGDTKAGHMWNGQGFHDHVSFDHHGFRTFHVGMGDGICICHPGQELRLTPARCAYRILWDSINAKTHPWESNPWVWALTFRRVEVQP